MLITVLKYVINERICSTLHHHHHNHNSVPNDDAPPSPRPAALPTGKKAGGPRVTGACRSMNLVPIQFSKKDCQKKLPPKKCEKQKKQRWVKQNLHAKNPIKKKTNNMTSGWHRPRHFMGNWLGCPAVVMCRDPVSKSFCANVAQWLLLRGPRLWSISPNHHNRLTYIWATATKPQVTLNEILIDS